MVQVEEVEPVRLHARGGGCEAVVIVVERKSGSGEGVVSVRTSWLHSQGCGRGRDFVSIATVADSAFLPFPGLN